MTRHRIPLFRTVALCLACCGCAPKENRTVNEEATIPCPLKHGVWEPLPALSDEFEGAELDASKWHPQNPHWKGRQPGFFHPKNVQVSDGKLHLTMRHEKLEGLPKGYHTYTCAAVKSTTKVRYGYFEIKAKPMDSKGSSAFWFYNGTPEIWTEIDVFEMGAGHPSHEHTVHLNAHVFHTLVNPDRHWSKGGKWKAPWRLADEYHVYALEWNRHELKYYVDGQVVRKMKNTHWHQPLHLNFDSETMPNWFGLPELDTLPSTFSIEYVRAWKRLDAPGPRTMESCTFRFPAANAAAVGAKRRTYRLRTNDEGRLLIIARFDRAAKPSRVHLEYDSPAFFNSQKAPSIRKRIGVKDKRGQEAFFTCRWSKNKQTKKQNAYRADHVDIEPATRPEPGTTRLFEFVSETGDVIQMELRY